MIHIRMCFLPLNPCCLVQCLARTRDSGIVGRWAELLSTYGIEPFVGLGPPANAGSMQRRAKGASCYWDRVAYEVVSSPSLEVSKCISIIPAWSGELLINLYDPFNYKILSTLDTNSIISWKTHGCQCRVWSFMHPHLRCSVQCLTNFSRRKQEIFHQIFPTCLISLHSIFGLRFLFLTMYSLIPPRELSNDYYYYFLCLKCFSLCFLGLKDIFC